MLYVRERPLDRGEGVVGYEQSRHAPLYTEKSEFPLWEA